jgi:hypothetical protein
MSQIIDEPMFIARKAPLGDSSYIPSCLKSWHGATRKFSSSVTTFFIDTSMDKQSMRRSAPHKHTELICSKRTEQKVSTIQAKETKLRAKLTREIDIRRHLNELEAEIITSQRHVDSMDQAAAVIQRFFRGWLEKRLTEEVSVNSAAYRALQGTHANPHRGPRRLCRALLQRHRPFTDTGR